MSRQDPSFQPKKQAAAGRPRDLESFALFPATREEERDLYTGFYEHLYEYMQKGRLDFHYLAERLQLRERRIRECMLFRLSSGEVMQLFGLKKGFCFVCEGRLHTKDTPEPVCLRCLNAFERMLEERYGSVDVSQHLHRSKFAGEAGELRALRVDEPQPQSQPKTNVPQQTPPVSEDIAALRQELERYKKTIEAFEQQTGQRIELISPVPVKPEIKPEVNADPPQQPVSHEETPQESRPEEKRISMRPADTTHRADGTPVAEPAAIQPLELQPEDQEFLALLDMEESQITAPTTEAAAPSPVMAGEPLRHYGFKRKKMKEA